MLSTIKWALYQSVNFFLNLAIDVSSVFVEMRKFYEKFRKLTKLLVLTTSTVYIESRIKFPPQPYSDIIVH